MAKPPPPERGPALLRSILGALLGERSPIGSPAPLDETELAAAETACGVALSPAMHALLSFDAGWVRRELGWLEPRSAADLMAEHAGAEVGEAYRAFAARRLPGLALPLDEGSDSMRLLYLGDPDALGEYPVLFVDHDDLPVIGVEDAGLDVWLARQLGLATDRTYAPARKAAAQRIFGRASDVSVLDVPARLGAPVAGPSPGSVTHARIEVTAAAPAAPKKARKLTDKQLAKALNEAADDENEEALRAAIAEAGARGLGVAPLERALLVACRGRSVPCVTALLDAGASPNARIGQDTPLSESTWSSSDDVMAALLARGAEADAPAGFPGQTALFSAAERGATARVKMLLAAGADPNRVDENRKMTPLHDAVLTHPGTGKAPPVETLVALLEGGARIEAGDVAWKPVLHTAVERGQRPHVERLLAAGADPNVRARYLGVTALHVAYDARQFALAPLLIAAGADRMIADDAGRTTEALFGPEGELIRPPTYYSGNRSP